MTIVEGITLCALVGVGLGVRAILKGQKNIMSGQTQTDQKLGELEAAVKAFAEAADKIIARDDELFAELKAIQNDSSDPATATRIGALADTVKAKTAEILADVAKTDPSPAPAPTAPEPTPAAEPAPTEPAAPTTTDQAP